jgi:DNA-binding LacI/PurR family transcriptional regulator
MTQRRVTLKDVATAAGVSYQTVSKIIHHQIQVSDETEERVWHTIERLNYQANHTAQSLRSQRSNTIGYSWPPIPSVPLDEANPILALFLQSIFQAAEERGYYLLCFPYHDNPEKHLDTYKYLIDSGRVDGFLLSSVEYQDARVIHLVNRNFPFVAFGRSDLSLPFPWIDVDGTAGMEMVVRHLLDLGHRRIGVLGWLESSRVGNNRLQGYFNALEAAGITPKPSWIARGLGTFSFSYNSTSAMLDLPASERPTAIICLTDAMAIAAMQAARDHKIEIGKDLAVASFDDTPNVQYLNPPLTSVRQPVWEVGQRIIPMLLSYVETGRLPEPMSVLVKPQLIIRESTAGLGEVKKGGPPGTV